MANNLTITNNDLGSVIFESGTFTDQLLTFAGAGTVLEGTILALDSVSKKLVPFVKGGVVNENGIAKYVVSFDVVAAGAGDESVRVMTSGSVRAQRLVIDADGDATNVDEDVLNGLRDFGIQSVDVSELNTLDNQ